MVEFPVPEPLSDGVVRLRVMDEDDADELAAGAADPLVTRCSGRTGPAEGDRPLHVARPPVTATKALPTRRLLRRPRTDAVTDARL